MNRLIALLTILLAVSPAFAWSLFGSGMPDEVSKEVKSRLIEEINRSTFYKYESGGTLSSFKNPQCFQTGYGEEVCAYHTIFEYSVIYEKEADLRPRFEWHVYPGEVLETIAHGFTVVLRRNGNHVIIWHDGFAEFHEVLFKYDDFVSVHEQEIENGGLTPEGINKAVNDYYAEHGL
jgi:hypothetical protein